jgi:hypothetical protein
MIRSKTFQSTSSMVTWFNRPENASLRAIGAIRESATTFAMIFEVPELKDAPGGSVAQEQAKALVTKLQEHQNYPEATKRKLHFPEGTLAYQVVPFTRLHNSLRNLKVFTGLTPSDLTEWMKDILPKYGFRILTRSEAILEYNANCNLIE